MTRLIECKYGDMHIAVAPALGGALAWLRWRGQEILRPLDPHGVQRANMCGSYPLIPWSNHIADGRFVFDDQPFQVTRNVPDNPHALHGIGWQQAWEVVSASETQIDLALTCPASACWPWPWRASQRFALTENGLTVTLTYHNLVDHAVPAGLGFHPFFADAARSEVMFRAAHVWLNDDTSLPAEDVAVPPVWDYTHFKTPLPGSVDNCFTGWNGEAIVRWPQRGIRATLHSSTPNLVFFVPGDGRNVVAIEPVSHINDAINRFPAGSNVQAMDRIAPGGELSLSMTIRMSDDGTTPRTL